MDFQPFGEAFDIAREAAIDGKMHRFGGRTDGRRFAGGLAGGRSRGATPATRLHTANRTEKEQGHGSFRMEPEATIPCGARKQSPAAYKLPPLQICRLATLAD